LRTFWRGIATGNKSPAFCKFNEGAACTPGRERMGKSNDFFPETSRRTISGVEQKSFRPGGQVRSGKKKELFHIMRKST